MRKRNILANLDAFTRGYIDCALWSSSDESTQDEYGNPEFMLDENYEADDLTLVALQSVIQDCRAFQRDNGQDLASGDLGDVRAGQDFWLTRNRHGAGFWDGDCPEPQATRLTDAAHTYGECNWYAHKGRVHAG